MKSKSGFTLIEVLVVLVVMAILISMSVFLYNQQQAESRNSRRILDAITLSTELDAYYQRNGNFPVTCGLPTSNMVSLRSCTGSNSASEFYTSSSMTNPDLLPADSSIALQETLPGISPQLRDPSADSAAPQINNLVGDQVSADSYFLLSPDMIYSGVGETHTQQFIKPSGGVLTCRYNLEAASSPMQSKPHQYVIGFPNEANGSWSFYVSEKTPDRLATTWQANTGSDTACEPNPLASIN